MPALRRAAGVRPGVLPGLRRSRRRCAATHVDQGWALRATAAAVVAAVGAAARRRRDRKRQRPRHRRRRRSAASRPLPTRRTGEAPVGPSGVAEWPTGEDGWTIALASLPQIGRACGRVEAGARRAQEGASPGRRARLVALREPASRVLDRLLGRVLLRGRGDERPRGRAQGLANGGRAARRALIRRCQSRTTAASRLCNTAEKALHSPCEAATSPVFRPVPRKSGRSSRSLDDHAAQLRSCMYQYSRAIYRSIKDLIDPYASRDEQLGYRRAVLDRVRAHDGATRRGSSLLRPSGSRAVRRHPALLPDHGAGPGRVVGARGRSARRRRSSSSRSRPGCSTAASHAAMRRRVRARRVSARRFPAATTARRTSISSKRPPSPRSPCSARRVAPEPHARGL